MEEYEICLNLQEAIAMGNIREAQNLTRKLAEKKINISMFPIKTNQTDLTDMHKTIKTVVCNIHNQHEKQKSILINISFYTKISEIKSLVSEVSFTSYLN